MNRLQNRSVKFLSMGMLALSAKSASASLVTFDDLPDPQTLSSTYYAAIPVAYSGFNWSNVDFVNIPERDSLFSTSGYDVGLISGTQDAFNGNGTTATLTSSTAGNTFNLSSGDFTAAWNDNLSVTATGYLKGSMVTTTTFTLSATSPTLEKLNFTNIDSATFSSSGGTLHGYSGGSGTQFVLDNLTVTGTSVPEPTALSLLSICGAWFLSRTNRQARHQRC